MTNSISIRTTEVCRIQGPNFKNVYKDFTENKGQNLNGQPDKRQKVTAKNEISTSESLPAIESVPVLIATPDI